MKIEEVKVLSLELYNEDIDLFKNLIIKSCIEDQKIGFKNSGISDDEMDLIQRLYLQFTQEQ